MTDFRPPHPSSVIRNSLLEPECMTVVLVIVIVFAELMIPGPAIHFYCTVISFVNFKAQGSASAPLRDSLCLLKQGRRDPAAGVLRGDRHGIESRDPAVSAKQHDGDADDRPLSSPHPVDPPHATPPPP